MELYHLGFCLLGMVDKRRRQNAKMPSSQCNNAETFHFKASICFWLLDILMMFRR
jgi:hypothetical protein